MDSIMSDCINPTEVMLEDIYEVLVQPEIIFKLDIDKIINLDFIEAKEETFNELKLQLEQGIDVPPINKKLFRRDSGYTNQDSDIKETTRDFKQIMGDIKL